jgi:hypothetical protein
VANTLTGLIPTLYEALDKVSRELVGFIPAVQRDVGNFERAAKGQVVTVHVAPSVTASDITAGVTAPNDGDQTIGTLNITISKSRYVPIRWNGEEQKGLNNNGPGANRVLVDQFTQAFRALGNEIEVSCAASASANASRSIGTAGTAPFGTALDLTALAGVAKILDDNGAPVLERHLILNSAAMANIRGKQTGLFKVNEAGTADLLRDGNIGRLEGFDVGYSAAVKPITAGTGSSYRRCPA